MLTELLQALALRLDEDPAAVLDAWRARDALRGRHITWTDGEGSAVGIDSTGALLVDTPEGERVSLEAGEVHLRAITARRGA